MTIILLVINGVFTFLSLLYSASSDVIPSYNPAAVRTSWGFDRAPMLVGPLISQIGKVIKTINNSRLDLIFDLFM